MTTALKLLFISFSVWTCSFSEKRVDYTGYATHRFFPQTEEDRKMLNILHEKNPGVIFLKQVGPVKTPVDILFAPHFQTDVLNTLTMQMPSEIMTENIQTMITAQEENIFQVDAIGKPADFSFADYWKLEKVEAFQNLLQATHPTLVTVKQYGTSFEGRQLRAVHVVEPGSAASKPTVVLDAGEMTQSRTHAREWITVATSCFFLNEIVSDKPEMVELRKQFNFVIVNCVNPDGYVYSWTTNRLWRKTRQVNSGNPLCLGVDPNRNYGLGWGGEGSSTDECSEIYRGTGAFSIPETQGIRNLVESQENCVTYISLHSYSDMILLGYGCNKDKPAYKNFDEHFAWTSAAATEMEKLHQIKYTTGNSQDILYEACGCSSDWALGSAKVPFATTFELRDDGTFGFLLPANQIQGTAEEFMMGYRTIQQKVANKLFGTAE